MTKAWVRLECQKNKNKTRIVWIYSSLVQKEQPNRTSGVHQWILQQPMGLWEEEEEKKQNKI